jgi:TrmH family RNA methyltransferase
MSRRVITGFSNPTVKFVRSLRDKKHRKREQRFLAEGLRLLTDARAGGRLPEILLMAQGREAHPLLAELEQAVSAAGGDVIELPVDILAKVTGKDNPQAVAGVFAEWDTGLDQIDRAAAPLWLVAQAMRDPGNLGTMLRTADAVGAGGLILLDDCVDPFSVEAVRASMGAIFTQGWRKRAGTNSCPGCGAQRASSSPPRCAMPCPIAAPPMPRPASSWSATIARPARRL